MKITDYEVRFSRAVNKRTGKKISKELISKERMRIKKALSLANINEDSKVLLLGVGTGVQLDECKKITRFVSAVDLNARSKEIKKFDLNSGPLPYRNNSFDIVIGLEVLEHLFYPNFILKEVDRVLNSNGQAILSLPNEYTLINKAKFFLNKPIEEHGFDAFGHHFIVNEKNAIEFIRRRFHIEKKIKVRNSMNPFRNSGESIFFKCVKKDS